MSDSPNVGLQALKSRPFDLLKELERRTKSALTGRSGSAIAEDEWVGIAFRLGEDNFLVNREDIREVMTYPSAVTRVPGAKVWISGLANVRGQLLPVADIKQYFGAGVTRASRTARVLVLNNGEYPVGILVDEVFGFRRFMDHDFNAEGIETVLRCERYQKGAYTREDESWAVLSMSTLVEAPEFQYAADKQ
ncbi:MAG: chemotaxis protein CheW [Gammaproteobacteria bacterium]